MDKNKAVIVNLIKSFFVTYAWMNIGGLESANILLLCVFFIAFLFLNYKDKIVEEKDQFVNRTSVVLGVVFTIFYALYADLSGGLESKLFIAVYTLASMVGLYVMFYELLTVVITKAVEYAKADKALVKKEFSWKVLLVNAAIVFACCLPLFALNFPAVMTTDSLNQLGQIRGTESLIDHHPWIHTMLIGAFYNIGYGITGSIYGGIAFYTVFQMLVVALSVGYAIECFYEMGLKKIWRIVLVCCFVLLPYNLTYAVTMWKDITFSMAVLVLTVTLMRIIEEVTTRDTILLIISSIGMCILRHNGFYAFLATAVVLLVAKRSEIKKFVLPVLFIIIVAVLCQGPVMKACGVQPGEKVFKYNILLQQVGRVVVDDGRITDEQNAWLENINSLSYIKAGYSKECTDNMTAWVLDGNRVYFDEHNIEFIKLWFEMGIQNPGEYFKAFVDITMGYWAPMQPYQTVYYEVTPNSSGIESKPLIRGYAQIKIHELLYKLHTMIPVYGLFYSMGGFFWIMLVECGICIAMNSKEKMLPFMPVFMLTLSLLVATPMTADLRYSYALMLVIPYMTAYILKGEN